MLGRGRYERGTSSNGRRHGHRPRQLVTPSARCSCRCRALVCTTRRASRSGERAMPAYSGSAAEPRRCRRGLSGGDDTRRVRRALAAVRAGSAGRGQPRLAGRVGLGLQQRQLAGPISSGATAYRGRAVGDARHLTTVGSVSAATGRGPGVSAARAAAWRAGSDLRRAAWPAGLVIVDAAVSAALAALTTAGQRCACTAPSAHAPAPPPVAGSDVAPPTGWHARSPAVAACRRRHAGPWRLFTSATRPARSLHASTLHGSRSQAAPPAPRLAPPLTSIVSRPRGPQQTCVASSASQ